MMLNTFTPGGTLLKMVLSTRKVYVLACQHDEISKAFIDQAMYDERRLFAPLSGKRLTNASVLLV
jgi:hypothetical protein